MTQTKTKKALLMSVLSMVLCVAMLVGMTFAWFTDTASTGVNKIQAGNLDVDIIGANDTNHIEKLNFTKATGAEGEQLLWEPGCRYLTEGFRIANNGNLALKWKAEINKDNIVNGKVVDTAKDGVSLLDVIDFYVVTSTDENAEAIAIEDFTGNLKKTENSGVYYIKGVMQTTAGNDYQNLTLDGITITVYATQLNSENDSYGPDYDKDAPLPTVVSNQDDVNSAIQDSTNKNVVLELPKGKTITLDNGIANEGSKSRNVTFVGDGTQTVDVATNAIAAEGANHLNYQRGSTFTFENVTVENGTDTYDGIVCDELIYKNCTIKGVTTLYGKATFINCKFENTMANQYSIWTWGGTDVAFEGCTFNTNGKAILLFGEEKTTNLTVNNCTFNDRTNGAAEKAAIEVGEANYGKHNNFTLVINNSSVASGFADGKNTGSKLWANKNSMSAEYLSVTINGTKVQ